MRTFRLKPEELDGRLGELERFPGYLRVVVEGRLSPAVKERLFQALPHLLAVETAGEGIVEPPPGLPELGFLEAYRRYLEERGFEEEALLAYFDQVLKEVELEALALGT